jgi:hypothetical protein
VFYLLRAGKQVQFPFCHNSHKNTSRISRFRIYVRWLE